MKAHTGLCRKCAAVDWQPLKADGSVEPAVLKKGRCKQCGWVGAPMTPLKCEGCGDLFPRPPMGRPALRCKPCRDKRNKAQRRARWIRWAKKQP